MRTRLPGIPKTDDAESAKIPVDRNKGLRMAKNKNTAAGILSAQGFGTRKECEAMIRKGDVEFGLQSPEAAPVAPHASHDPQNQETIVWRTVEDPSETVDTKGLHVRAGIFAFPCRDHLYLAFHKPADTECSHTPSHHQSIFSYFPEPFLNRGLEAIGRLDADTTGLLLLTDSGPLNHFLTSPKKHVSKTYRVGVKHPISPEQIQKLSAGVELRGEDGMTRPAAVELIDERNCDLTVQEGKYHQVKRMFAAVGNRVESIHRIAIGPIRLEPELQPGKWRLLEETEMTALGFKEP
jgi:16S rRNA pseudouridine516 synthase